LIENTLYAGATITVRSSNGLTCSSVAQDPTPVVCVTPNSSLVVNPDNTSICSGFAATNIQVLNSENIYRLSE
jgi:hypothetical protein